MFNQLDDTIIAISSPPGMGVRGVIRLSGPRAMVLADSIFDRDDNQSLFAMAGHHCIAGRIRVDGGSIPAEAYVFRAPASYTRQDVVELHSVGSPPVLAVLLDALVTAGARPADPGEFTARAYFNGALDLTRVEGVSAIIHASNDSQLRASEALLHGGLSKRSTALRDQLADLLALIEAEIDFVEEPIEFISRQELEATIGGVTGQIDNLLRLSQEIERLEVLPEVLLIGRPNAGKSTLFNRLTGMDRAIRSAVAGTTRDVIRAPLTVPGGEIMLADTAGLSGDADESDAVGILAEQATHRSMASADLLMMVIDVTHRPAETAAKMREVIGARPACWVFNKIDQIPARQRADLWVGIGTGNHSLPVSSLTGDGVEHLKAHIGRFFFTEAGSHGGELLALSLRQRTALQDAQAALIRAREIIVQIPRISERIELIAVEIREAMNALSLLTGQVATEELLGRIFSRFCIGK
jgi:tRNA modification GTPase